MKPILILVALFYSISCYSQELKLDISLPQPRLGQRFYLSFSSDTLSKQIFNLAPGKFKIISYTSFAAQETNFSVQLEALKIGQNEIGPLSFNFNGNTYKTNTIKFTVADSLPNVNKGIWIRKVPVNDTTVYILIDQRIPTQNHIVKNDSNTITMSAEISNDEKEAGLKSEDTENAKIEDWGSSSETLPDFTGKGSSYASFYKCFKVTIKVKGKPIVLEKQAFDNLPEYYKFQNIRIN
jgi:hypothetical protein